MSYVLYVYVIFELFKILVNAKTIIINIEGGKIKGLIEKTENGQTIYFFLGVPYAEPPVRFELAIKKKPWQGTLDCTYDKSECVQGGFTLIVPDEVTGSEDCLFLNVYSPDINANLPVMVWIHGGYFIQGNASQSKFPPDFFVNQGVVFVAIQYRLGVFGFMSTKDMACPGNLGFKDQVVALQWIQNNIKYFGGDPAKVTIFGESAGAISVSLHLQSIKSKGLFASAIMQSGVSFSSWSYNRRCKQATESIAKRFGVWSKNSTLLVKGLKTLPYKNLQNIARTVTLLVAAQNPFSGTYFGYVSEPEYDDAFFTGKSEQLLSQGNFHKVPILLGFNSNEGAFFKINVLVRLYLAINDVMVTNLVPASLTNSTFDKIRAYLEIKKEFFGLRPFSLLSQKDITTFITLDQWVRPIHKFAEIICNFTKSVYVYEFAYQGQLSPKQNPDVKGVGHVEELGYEFNNTVIGVSDEDDLTRRRFTKLFANFAKYSNPTPTLDDLFQNRIWPSFCRDNSSDVDNYFLINSTLSLYTTQYDKGITFYEELYEKYGEGEYDTY